MYKRQVLAHADGQAAVEVGLADDVPAAPGEMLLVAGTGLQQEIEFAVVLETDDVLATQAACDLAQDAALLLDDRRSGTVSYTHLDVYKRQIVSEEFLSLLQENGFVDKYDIATVKVVNKKNESLTDKKYYALRINHFDT